METIDKPVVQILSTLLSAYGVEDVVVSSGTRCAPVTIVLSRSGKFRLHPVIDERSAGFVGLGMALSTGRPVALVCTSGSAPLNYAPALSEAYYRRVPLVAISADRPEWWIGQREGQTIRQAGCLDAVVRCSVDLRPDDGKETSMNDAVRLINKALTAATGFIPGPVHINIQIDEPMNVMAEERQYAVPMIPCCNELLSDDSNLESLDIPDCIKTLLVVGGVRLGKNEREAIESLTELPGIVVVAETQSNIRGSFRPALFDKNMKAAPVPEFLAIIGGDFVSGRFKKWLRNVSGNIRHIVSCTPEDEPVITFGHLTANVPCHISTFCHFLRKKSSGSIFRGEWQSFIKKCKQPENAPALAMMREIVSEFPCGDLHISNGSAIRYIQHIDIPEGVIVECNRGVSGIDGCTSTAIGSAMVSKRPTLLITGDMSAAYDVGALAIRDVPPTFKMVILDNNGGDIFRNIPTTSGLPELELYFAMPPLFPLRQLAEAYGFAFFEAEKAGQESITSFMRHTGRAILNLKLNPKNNKNLI